VAIIAADPDLGASGGIAAVLGAYFVLYPSSNIFGLVVVFPVRVSAWFFLVLWSLYQRYDASFGMLVGCANRRGTAFFAHIGAFVFEAPAARVLVGSRRVAGDAAALGAPA
jgi:membrane associated rhomboid family serine protease